MGNQSRGNSQQRYSPGESGTDAAVYTTVTRLEMELPTTHDGCLQEGGLHMLGRSLARPTKLFLAEAFCNEDTDWKAKSDPT